MSTGPTTAKAPAVSREDLESVIGPVYRVPRVDLLPREVLAGRRLRTTQRASGAALVALLAALAGVYALSLGATSQAADELAVEQSRTAQLQAEQARYAQVPLVYAKVDAAQAALRTAMATDVRWYDFLGDLAATYPAGVWLTSLNASVDPAVPATGSGSALATPGIGSVTFGGTSLSHPQVADWLDVLGATTGLADPAVSTSERTAVDEQPVVTFESSVTVTPDALSRRYEQETP